MKTLRYLSLLVGVVLTAGVAHAQEVAAGPANAAPALPPCTLKQLKTRPDADNSRNKSATPLVSIAAPQKPDPAIEALAAVTAQTIVSRNQDRLKGQTVDPCERLEGEWRKTVLFALALAANPQKVRTIQYIGTAQAETNRTDKQVSASSSTTGSNSAVEKSGLPDLLGIAIDHGAINQNIDGSTLNLTSSLYALPALFKGDTADTYKQYSEYTRVGFSAAYNLQDKSDPLASVTRKNLNEWVVKIRLLGDHSARSADAHRQFADTLEPILKERAIAISGALTNEFGEKAKLIKVPESLLSQILDYLNDKGFIADAATSENAANKAEKRVSDLILQAVTEQVYGRLGDFELTTADVVDLGNFLDSYKASTEAYVNAAKTFDQQIKALAEKPSLTLGYFNERGSGTPAYSVVKLLFEKKPKQFMQIDANVSSSFYGNPDKTKNERTFRDAAAALGLEQKLGRSPFLTNDSDQNQITVSFSGRYERLQENRHIPGKKADIAVANWKLEIPIAAGISLPLSVTYANATELIKESHVRGNFGITFDLDKLKALAGTK